jgi:predicted TIM-barrel fold metal-dependent hydrolase
MKGKIAFEEHFSLPETLDDSRGFAGGSARWEDFERQILDIDEERLRLMDRNGIGYTILSLNAPAVQAILDTQRAIDVSRRANDRIAEAVRKHPQQFGGFAALPMQDPDAAAKELTRCVKDLGFKGALSTTTSPPTATSGRWCRTWTCRSTCTRAPRSRRVPRPTPATPGS